MKGDPLPAYWFEQLHSRHDRLAFACGVPPLDAYLQRQASQDQDRRLAAVFVLTSDSHTIAGFYTLSAHTLQAVNLPAGMGEKLPRFPLPVTLLGRMALSKSLQGLRLGEVLLMDVLERAWKGSLEVAPWAVIVDAKLGPRDFYSKYDFIALSLQTDRLFLPMKSIDAIFGS